jgi:hypothetical protein
MMGRHHGGAARFHKQLHHPVVDDIPPAYEAADLPDDTGQRTLVDTAKPGRSDR